MNFITKWFENRRKKKQEKIKAEHAAVRDFLDSKIGYPFTNGKLNTQSSRYETTEAYSDDSLVEGLILGTVVSSLLSSDSSLYSSHSSSSDTFVGGGGESGGAGASGSWDDSSDDTSSSNDYSSSDSSSDYSSSDSSSGGDF